MENVIEEFKKYFSENKEKVKNSNGFEKCMKGLEEFNIEYPLEKFGDISLNEYAIGTNNKKSLCYKLEFGKYKYCGPGIGGATAYKYGIYFSKDKNAFVNKKDGILDNVEEKWRGLKNDIIKVLFSIKNAQEADDIDDNYESLKGMSMVIIKIACCYFPDKMISIAGRKQLKSVLDFFNINYNDEMSSTKLAFVILKEIKRMIPELESEHSWLISNILWDFYIMHIEKDNSKNEKRTWIFAPGENASKWEEFYNEGIIAIGWDSLGDLKQYENKKEIKENLTGTGSRRNDVCANWDFANVMQIGDNIFAKKGVNKILGRAIVESDYIYDDSREEYKSYRKVKWINNKEKNHKEMLEHGIVQKTLTDITKYTDYVEKLNSMYDEDNNIQVEEGDYDKYNFLEEIFMEEEKYDDIVNTLLRKKNIILQGVPGVGKTFCAKKLMYSIMNKKDDLRIRTVQFHQSYSYEDFIQGFRPNDEGNFELKNGVFYDLVIEARRECEMAKKLNVEPKKYCIIIDEINRGNLSKVFGELMMLIESDKREKKWSVKLTYSDEDFYIPENLYIIGTMNTADRSLTMVDYALRRRFAFIELVPAFKNVKFKKYLVEKEKIDARFVDKLIEKFSKLNDFITDTIGREFTIGHSYFVNQDLASENYEEIYDDIIKYEIKPLLEEYYYDDKEKVNEALRIISIG